jgi:hypothetical protein
MGQNPTNSDGDPRVGRLRELTRLLLDGQASAEALRPEVLELTAILASAQISVSMRREGIAHGETRTAEGLALSPPMALLCADDYLRTIRFIRGTFAAIADLGKQLPGRPVRVFYVGCGPLATLVIPLMSVLPPERVTFALIDIHKLSIESAKSIVSSLGFSDSVTSCELADAAHYRIPRNRRPDLILMEILQACLESEPQVALTHHLLRQAPDALLIPEQVRIDLALVDLSREFDLGSEEERDDPVGRDRIKVATLFTLNCRQVELWGDQRGDRLPAAKVQIANVVGSNYRLMMFTFIGVYGDEKLEDYDSGLTCPRYFAFNDAIQAGDIIQFHYALGANPGLRATPSQTADRTD